MLDTIEKEILAELECPVCDHIMSPPICQCQNGHSICNECFKKVKNCPTCRAPKNHQARSYALEAIHSKLRVPCRNSFVGCEITLLGENITQHQKFCKLTKRLCPFTTYDSCTWKDVRSKLKAHLSKEHISNFYIKEKQRFMAQNFKQIDTFHYIYAVIYAHKEFFRLTWDVDPISGMTRWAVYFLGSPDEAQKYSFRLEFYNPDNERSWTLLFKSPCYAAPEKDSVKFMDHKYFSMQKSVMNSYCDKPGQLNYRVTIYADTRNDEEEISGLLKELSTED